MYLNCFVVVVELTTGLVNAGLNIIAGINVWDKAIDSYKRNHDHLAIYADLTKLTPADFKKTFHKKNKLFGILFNKYDIIFL